MIPMRGLRHFHDFGGASVAIVAGYPHLSFGFHTAGWVGQSRKGELGSALCSQLVGDNLVVHPVSVGLNVPGAHPFGHALGELLEGKAVGKTDYVAFGGLQVEIQLLEGVLIEASLEQDGNRVHSEEGEPFCGFGPGEADVVFVPDRECEEER